VRPTTDLDAHTAPASHHFLDITMTFTRCTFQASAIAITSAFCLAGTTAPALAGSAEHLDKDAAQALAALCKR
jgi:hypothetical protein